MNRVLPPAVLSPARADRFRASDLSLTVTIEDRSPAHGRRFAFHAARPSDRSVARWPDIERTLLLRDKGPDPTAAPDHADVHSSAAFLAGAIVQARPGAVLHNLRYREAAIAYRRSDSLGAAGVRLGFRSDQKV